MQSEQHRDLWIRINEFKIDDPLASVKYSDKLAYNNGWSKDYATRVIEEYKKFIFLCCVLPKGASPSKPIDEAWHLHLTYTYNYWKGLCAGVIGKEIHHFPSKGGPEEKEKHIQWYNETLDGYRDIFGQEAPDDIWIRELSIKLSSKIDNNTAPGYAEWYKKYSYVLPVPFLLILILYGKINPYQLTGPQFLVFYSCLIVAVIIYLLLIREKKKKVIRAVVVEKYEGDADLYQLARFVYGRERSLRAAVVDLVERKVLNPVRKGQFTYYSSNYKYSSSEKNPLAIHLLRNVKEGEIISFAALSGYYDDASTYHTGLSDLYKTISVKDRLPVIIAVVIGLIGVTRIIQGSYNDMPVSFLLTIGLIYFIIMAVMVSFFSGQNILQDIFRDKFKNGGQGEFQSAALASAFVFLGLTYISGMDGYSQLQDTFGRHRDNSGGGSSGGCGSSGCGSDGGGCGGGGCGGCGGGD